MVPIEVVLSLTEKSAIASQASSALGRIASSSDISAGNQEDFS